MVSSSVDGSTAVPAAMPRCSTETPRLRPAQNRLVACHLFDGAATPQAAGAGARIPISAS